MTEVEKVETIIARHITRVRYEDLPAPIVATTKERIMDNIGCVVAGSAAPGCNLIADQLFDWGGKPESTVMVLGRKLPSHHAAQIHGSWAHAYDFDDNDDRNAFKGTCAIVPASLALAERQRASGKDLILAVAIGLDLGCRIGLALRKGTGISRHEGYFSAAAAGAKLLSLDEEGVLNAMGISYTQLATTGTSTISPSLTKRLLPGQVARSAVWADLLAQRGFPACRDFLHGPTGYYCSIRKEEGNLDELTRELGARFEVKHCPKPYPCCRFTHAPIDAAFAILTNNHFSNDDIESIRIGVSARSMGAIGGELDGTGLAEKQRPTGVVDAQFSAPYCVAVTLKKKGPPDLRDFKEAAIGDPGILALAARATVVHRPDLDQWPEFITPAAVEIRLKDGRLLSKEVQYARGNVKNPLSPKEMRVKFLGCIENSARPLSPRAVERAMELLGNLEDVKDISSLLKLMVP